MLRRLAGWLEGINRLPHASMILHQAQLAGEERRETYFSLVWWRFRRHRLARVGAAYLLALGVISLLAPFFSPYDPNAPHLKMAYAPPQRLHWVDSSGRFYWIPFTYKRELTLDPETWTERYVEDSSKGYQVRFFRAGVGVPSGAISE